MDILLDDVDKRILDIVQADFPLAARPYAEIGKRLGISEEEAFKRVQAMRKNKIIRRMGANFQSKKLGFTSTLCAAKVAKEELDEFISMVNSIPGVTHNYLRAHQYNVWFTLISSSKKEACHVLNDLTEKSGITIINLPATRLFKIKVDFPMGKDCQG